MTMLVNSSEPCNNHNNSLEYSFSPADTTLKPLSSSLGDSLQISQHSSSSSATRYSLNSLDSMDSCSGENTHLRSSNPRIALLEHHDDFHYLHGRTNPNKIRAMLNHHLGIHQAFDPSPEEIHSWESVETRIGSEAQPYESGVNLFDYQSADSSKAPRLLYREISSILRQLESDGDGHLSQLHQERSIPQRVIETAKNDPTRFPQLARILTVAESIVANNDAVILPGGYHISPIMYGDPLDLEDIMYNMISSPGRPDIQSDKPNLQREMMEFGLIHASKQAGKPLLGICRGHQAINVYHGATLVRDKLSSLQSSVTRDVETTCSSRAINRIPKTARFMHSQLVKVTEQSEQSLSVLADSDSLLSQIILQQSVIENEQETGSSERTSMASKRMQTINELIKFLDSNKVALVSETEHGVAMLGLQFHPEYFYGSTDMKESHSTLIENAMVLGDLVDLARYSANKKAVIRQLKSLSES